MSTDLQIIQQLPEDRRRMAIGWAQLGDNLRLNEMAIAAKVDSIPATYPLPADITQLEAYDKQRAELSNIANSISQERTSTKEWQNLTAYISRRTAKEGEVKAYLQAFDAALLPLKKQAEAEADKARTAAIDLQNCRAQYIRELADLQLRCNTIIANTVSDLYKRALDKDAVITPDVMKAMKAMLNAQSFVMPSITESTPERQAICEEILGQHNTRAYEDAYHRMLTEQFADFENAKKHKIEALAQLQYNTDTAVQEAAQVAEHGANIAAITLTETVTVVADGKAIKRTHIVDMEQTPTNANIIMAAFTANNGWEHVRVRDAFNLSIKQMADVLGKLKSDGTILGIIGVNFKEVEKV